MLVHGAAGKITDLLAIQLHRSNILSGVDGEADRLSCEGDFAVRVLLDLDLFGLVADSRNLNRTADNRLTALQRSSADCHDAVRRIRCDMNLRLRRWC